MFADLYYYICGRPKKPPGYYKRLKYLLTVSRYEMIEASLPVFIAAGISGSATGIIKVLSEEDEYLEIILALIYALTMYFVGKVLTCYLLKDELNNSKGTVFTILRKYKFEMLARHSLMELSGFAWKEFFILLCLKQIYLVDGFGSAFGAWLMIIALAVLTIRFSSIIQRRVFRFDSMFNQKLLSFDTGSFALSIGYILAVLLCLGAYEIGIGFVPDNNLIFEWNDHFEDDSPSTMFASAGPTLLFTLLVLSVVAALQIDDEMPEEIADEICVPVPEPPEVTGARLSNPQFGFDRQDRVLSASSTTSASAARTVTGSFSGQPTGLPNSTVRNPLSSPNHAFELENVALSTPSASTVTATRSNHAWFECILDPDASANCVYMWNEFLGYFAGVSFYILVLVICSFDFRYKIVPALVVALIATYNAPQYLAKLRISAEELTAKRLDRELANSGNSVAETGAKNVNPNFVTSINAAADSKDAGDDDSTNDTKVVRWWSCCNTKPTSTNTITNTTTADTHDTKEGCCGACARWLKAMSEFYSENNIRRKGVMMVACRLTVGWVWETVLVYLFDLMEGSSDLEPYQAVLVEISFAAAIVSIVLCVHLYVRDWAEEGGEQETERLNDAVREIRDSGAAVEEGQA